MAKTVLVATRMELAERKQIRIIAAVRGMTISEHLADIIRRDLRQRERKAAPNLVAGATGNGAAQRVPGIASSERTGG